MKNNYLLRIFKDRHDTKYMQHLAYLLTKEALIKNAEEIRPTEPHYGKYKRRVSIKFCGLSGLSLLGGNDTVTKAHPQSVTNFLNLISNHQNIIDDLNREGIVVDVKLMFAYPYSDSMYDWIQAEESQQDGFSIKDIVHGRKVKPDFRVTKKMDISDIKSSFAYINLKQSLVKLQDAVIKGKTIFNNKNTSNRVIVKFTPVNVLVCVLKINHSVFIDPYIYSKETSDSNFLKLNAPISEITVPYLPSPQEAEMLRSAEKTIHEHFCSITSHFRYLWQHPYTIYSTDATHYRKWRRESLGKIKSPEEVSYLGKATRLMKIRPGYKQNEVDLWMQYCKNGLLKFCSKINNHIDDVSQSPSDGDISSIEPTPIFIIGSWVNDGERTVPSQYMDAISNFISINFSSEAAEGLRLNPILVRAENGQKLQDTLFKDLNMSELGIAIVTPDVGKIPRPNVSLERGYLMGRLGSRKSRSFGNSEKQMVYVFKHEDADGGSDTIDITYTPFKNIEDFEALFYKFIKWLWDVTELNSDYALKILRDQRLNRRNSRADIEEIDRFIDSIAKWQKDYSQRMSQFDEEAPTNSYES